MPAKSSVRKGPKTSGKGRRQKRKAEESVEVVRSEEEGVVEDLSVRPRVGGTVGKRTPRASSPEDNAVVGGSPEVMPDNTQLGPAVSEEPHANSDIDGKYKCIFKYKCV